MKFAEVKKHLSTKKYFPAYIITGEDAFLRHTAESHFKKIITTLPELNLSYLPSTSLAQELVASLETLPIAADTRLVVCHDFKGDTSSLETYFQHPNPSSILLFVSEKLTDNLAKIMPKLTIVDCAKLEEAHIYKWMTHKLMSMGVVAEESALTLLVSYCAYSMTRITVELEKLGYYKRGGTLTQKDVKYLVEPELEVKIFELSESVSVKNGARTQVILQSLLQTGSQPITLLGMLYSHFRRLLFVAIDPTSSDTAKHLGVKEYAIKMARQAAKAFSVLRLKAICDAFHTLDYAVKSGAISDRLGLENYILKILLGQ